MTNKKSVPVCVAAKVYGKDPSWIRAGIIAGWLPIGTATRNGKTIEDVSEISSKKGRINYYISPKKLYDETGYMYEDGDEEMKELSIKNKYYINKLRYYELKYYCLQYNSWLKEKENMSGLYSSSIINTKPNTEPSDITSDAVKWYSKVATPCTFKYNKNVRRSSHVKETLHKRFQDRSRKRIYEREYVSSY